MARWYRPILAILLFAVFGSLIRAENWPGWRGDGNGVSNGTQSLPVVWGPEENVLWKTAIEGDGISSPIVWEDKVFVTTAREWPQADLYRTVFAATLIGLVMVALVAALSTLIGGRRGGVGGKIQGPAWLKLASWLDRGLTIGAAVLFVAGILSLARKLFLGPDAVDEGFVTDSLPYSITVKNLFLMSSPAAWVISGKLAVLGLVATIGYARMHSVLRFVGAIILLGATGVFLLSRPFYVSGTAAMSVNLLWIAVVPLLFAAVWFLLTFLVSRRLPGIDSAIGGSSAARALYPVAMIAAVALSFFSFNYLKSDELQRTVLCLDRDSGEILWQKVGFDAPAEPVWEGNSHATPTPATDGTHIVASFGHGLVGMDFDGNVEWRRMEPKYMEYLRYGVSSSPVIAGDRVIYAFMPEMGRLPRERGDTFGDLSKNAYLAALDKTTGEELWRAQLPEPSAHDSYGTPLVVSAGGRTVVLYSTYHHATAFDVETGEQAWVVEIPLEQPVPSFIADEDTAYLTGGVHGPAAAAAIRLGGSGNITDTHVKWTITKGVTGVSSPVLYDGLLYWVTENGILYCVDAVSGDLVWRKRLEGGHLFHGSLIAGDGKVYVPAINGQITVIAAGREFELLAANEIGEASLGSPAIAHGRIFIRGENHLFCIADPEAGS